MDLSRVFRAATEKVFARLHLLPDRDNKLDLGSSSARWYDVYFGHQLKSDVATGTAPFVVASTTVVANLNADSVDGLPGHSAVTLGADADTVLGLTDQAIGLDTQTANYVFAGPVSGAAADPTFRALVNADIPTDTDTYNDSVAKNLGTDADGGVRVDHIEAGNITGAAEGQVAAAAGFVFPAAQNAQAGANVLDDYEEGTWTPTLGGNTTYTAQTGRYVKVGKIVHAACYLAVNAVGTGSTSGIGGLPFTSATSAGFVWGGIVPYYQTLSANMIYVSCYVGSNTTAILFTGIAAAGVSMTNAPAILGNSTIIYCNVSYETAN